MSDWFNLPINTPDDDYQQQARLVQSQLTKPQGSLGVLENIAIQISALQKTTQPNVSQAQIVIFAADHGIAQEGVSAFPQSVTAEMVRNFSSGGAAISVLARQHKLALQIINLGLLSELEELENVINYSVGEGTKNFLYHEAVSVSQFEQISEFIKNRVDRLKNTGLQLIIAGEMGIANTTSATALICALQSLAPEQITGTGTGLDKTALAHKVTIISQALNRHKTNLTQAVEILRILGGFEIIALCAMYLRCAQRGIVSVVDGFICTVAALFAIHINAQCRDWLIFSHQSAETGHKIIMDLNDIEPLLDFNLRLGEASGAALVYPLIHSACLLQSQMASFDRAAVSKKNA